jgi:hypothetical protein
MAMTKMRIGFWLPTISVARVNDCLSELTPILQKHRASGILASIKGPYEDDQERANGKEPDKADAGSGRLERAEPGERSRAARDAFAEPDAPAPPPNLSSADADAPASQTQTEAPRRRGRPPKDGSAPATPRAPTVAKAHSEMSLSELGKALTRALDKARAGQEALNEAGTINEEIAKRLG